LKEILFGRIGGGGVWGVGRRERRRNKNKTTMRGGFRRSFRYMDSFIRQTTKAKTRDVKNRPRILTARQFAPSVPRKDRGKKPTLEIFEAVCCEWF
jgi:hypothetical protein